MDSHRLFRAAPPYLHLWNATPSEAYEFAWSIQSAPGRRAVVRVIRGGKARTTTELFNEIGAALQFPDYFGDNFDALFECLTDLEWLPAPDYAMIVSDSQLLLEREPGSLATFLKVLENVAHEWARPDEAHPDQAHTARPFHIVFQCDPDHAAAVHGRFRQIAKSIDVLPE